MPKRLSDSVIDERMVELRNIRSLHKASRAREKAKDARIAQLEADNKALHETIDTLKIQIAELQTMVFGKKRKPPTGTPPKEAKPLPPSKPRDKTSYRRSVPPASSITSEALLSLPDTCNCGGDFDQSSISIHERYEQDIPLPNLTTEYRALSTVKQFVQRGVCLDCGKATVGIDPTTNKPKDLGGQKVTFGPNAKLLVCHLISVVGMSYTQVGSLLLALYGLSISEGEIATILQKKKIEWTPSYQKLQATIRAAPSVHVDETSWPIQDLQGQGYGWVLAPSTSPLVCFTLENSRGAPHAQKLLKDYSGIRITDDYGVYRNSTLPGQQQLCWAHLYRVIRDLRYNQNTPEEQLSYVTEWYGGFASIYQDLRTYLEQPFDYRTREQQAKELWQRIHKHSTQAAPANDEPQKLTRLKAQLLRAGKDKLFTCLPANTPCDNNRAERDLRALVIKRKSSFGSRTVQGANALATVMSLCTTTWRTNPDKYFQSLAALG